MSFDITNIRPVHNKLPQLLLVAVVILGALISGCTPFETIKWPEASTSLKATKQPKSIFVFLDGTANNPETATNVYRLFAIISTQNDPLTTGIYIEGVGATKGLAIEKILGLGMEDRVLKSYSFLAENYKPGDKIYIFGFSRGAFEARNLAGLLAYSGLPKVSGDDVNYLEKIGNKILELTKEKNDSDYVDKWNSWILGDPPLLAKEIKDSLNLETQAAEVTFLGIWDTVPGSFFKDYDTCKEKKNRNEGDRYKTDTYPAIREIAHAVSIDEKRSKFKPVLACTPIKTSKPTHVDEVWFPGAHADVGGGYENPKKFSDVDSKDLPGISLNWMLDLLGESYDFKADVPRQPEKTDGLAHWSFGDFPGNWRSDCIDREQQFDAETLKKVQKHKSYEDRVKLVHVPIEKDGEVESSKYPIVCPTK